MFKKATKAQAKLRLGLIGPSGSGKTFTALRIAKGLGGRIAVVDTERGSASKYAGDVAEFDVAQLDSFAPKRYVEAIQQADAAGYDVLIIDSLSHAWMGKDGALEQVDKAAKRSQSGNTFAAWRDVTPQHNAMVDAILQSKCHVIVTIRAKTEHVLEDDGNGKKVPKKKGMAPIQRDGLEYEFDLVGDLDLDHTMTVSKTRCRAFDREVIHEPGEDVGGLLLAWLTDGVEVLSPAEQFRRDYDALIEDLRNAETSEDIGQCRAEASRLKPRMGRELALVATSELKEATERVLKLEEAAQEAAEAERAIAAKERAEAAQAVGA